MTRDLFVRAGLLPPIGHTLRSCRHRSDPIDFRERFENLWRDASPAPISASHLRYPRLPGLNALVHRFESVLLTQFAPAIELLDDKVHILLRQVFPKLKLGIHCWVTMRV